MKTYFQLLTFITFISIAGKAQMPGMGSMKGMKDPKLGRVYGKILDNATGLPVEYASVQVLWYSKDSLLGGSLVKPNGDFAVDGLPSFGQIRVKVQFIGYKNYIQKVYLSPPDKVDQDLGDIRLMLDDKTTREVEITAEKSTVTLGIDRRIYNVDKDLSAKGGTAVDVMKNVTEQFNKQMSELINRLVQENFAELNKSVQSMNDWQKENKDQIKILTDNFQKTTELVDISSKTLSEVALNSKSLIDDNSKLVNLVDTLEKVMISDNKFIEITNNLVSTIDTLKDTTDSFEETTNKLNDWVRTERNFKDSKCKT